MTTIVVDPESELARALETAEAPVQLDIAGVRYTVDRVDVFADYDVQAVLAALAASRGALAGVDRDQLLADLRAERDQDSIGRPA